ncbi:hypothetical protein [uncultured Bacteroides sp.]|uniref:hypothetical protein n=1 Tax=uncultured Bacteroides sp. TaxID=162156 RepID=UPI002AA737F5|nr:hypothetical protein [uncultured Bacteroides sp.]
MKKPVLSILVLTVFVFLSSCTSSKLLQKEIRTIRGDLFYELTTPVYSDSIKHDVYLNFIDYSNIDYETSVKRRSALIIPLILVNYVGESFNVTLGEGSLNMNFREFLTQALTTECNNSTCFNLLERGDSVSEKGKYILNVKITHCRTSSRIKLNTTSVLWFDDNMVYGGDYAEFNNDKVRPAYTDLDLDVTLSLDGKIIHHKSYTTTYKQACGRHSIEMQARTEVCLNTMTKCLSFATKNIVEDVAKDLHLVLLNEKQLTEPDFTGRTSGLSEQ